MGKAKLLQMHNVSIVVDDLKAAIAFFAELGLELEGENDRRGTMLVVLMAFSSLWLSRSGEVHNALIAFLAGAV